MNSKISQIIQSTLNILEENNSHGNNFNLLKICGVSNSEVFTHTPILKELLDPEGTHGQKDIFLKSFVEFFKLDFKIRGNIKTKKEQRFNDYGQIDLMIENEEQIIILENKIYAVDQSKQLQRYFNFCKNYAKKQPLLIYLTLFGNEPSFSSLGNIKKVDNKYLIQTNNELINVNLRCLSYKIDIISWLEDIKSQFNHLINLQSALNQYINLLRILTNELVTVNKELKNMLLEMTPNELQAIKQISNQFNSSNYRGDLLFKLFAYFEHKFIETGNYEMSPEFQDIHYTFKNCQQWFKQLSNLNPESKRNVIGCVLRSKKNLHVTFLFVAAKDNLHYGITLSEECHFNLNDLERLLPTWGQAKQWKKIPDGLISKGIENLRNFSGDAFKLLAVKDNNFLDNFIKDRLQEMDIILKL